MQFLVVAGNNLTKLPAALARTPVWAICAQDNAIDRLPNELLEKQLFAVRLSNNPICAEDDPSPLVVKGCNWNSSSYCSSAAEY